MSVLEDPQQAAPSCGAWSAAQAHSKLKQALAALASAERSAVLIFAEILRRKLYRELGYSSIQLYASEALGFSPSKTSQFLGLADSFRKLPELKAAVARGEVSWTKAREVARVATPASERAWVAEAKHSSRRVLARKVSEVKEQVRQERRADPSQQCLGDELSPSAPAGGAAFPAGTGIAPTQARASVALPPVALTFRLEGLDLARFDAIMARLRRLGLEQPREKLLLEALAAYAESIEMGNSSLTEGAPFTRVKSCTHQIVLYKCERCAEAQVVTSHGRRPVSRSALERVECDAQVLDSSGRRRSSIPPATRRGVLARDGYRCRVRGCGGTQFLEVHHIKARCDGGSNKPENLITLCSSCHQLLHERGLAGPLVDPSGALLAASPRSPRAST